MGLDDAAGTHLAPFGPSKIPCILHTRVTSAACYLFSRGQCSPAVRGSLQALAKGDLAILLQPLMSTFMYRLVDVSRAGGLSLKKGRRIINKGWNDEEGDINDDGGGGDNDDDGELFCFFGVLMFYSFVPLFPRYDSSQAFLLFVRWKGGASLQCGDLSVG